MASPPVSSGADTIALLAQALQHVSDDIKRDVGGLIPQAADWMLSSLHQRYPYDEDHRSRYKHMRDDMRIQNLVSGDPLIPRQRVIGPKLAYIWQDGTDERYYFTRRGVKHRTGAQRPADPGFFERTAVQARAHMMLQAQQLLDRDREIG